MATPDPRACGRPCGLDGARPEAGGALAGAAPAVARATSAGPEGHGVAWGIRWWVAPDWRLTVRGGTASEGGRSGFSEAVHLDGGSAIATTDPESFYGGWASPR